MARRKHIPKTVLILGLGRYRYGSGIGAALYCLKRGDTVVVSDAKPRTAFREQLSRLVFYGKRVRYAFGQQNAALLDGVDLIIRNPGIRNTSPVLAAAARKAIPIETDVSLFLSSVHPKHIIGVTGTRGKSTTSAMTHAILKRSGVRSILAGNIQRSPLFDVGAIDRQTVVVLELSSWQLEHLAHLSWSPDIAVITNIYRDHLNSYPSYTAYAHAKELLVAHQTKRNTAILNRDVPETRSIGRRVLGRRWWFSARSFPEENGTYLRGTSVVVRKNGKTSVVADVASLPGAHLRMNACAAIAASLHAGATRKGMTSAVKRYRSLPGRLEYILTRNGITYINDTTSTTPEAAIAALITVPGPITLITGGTDKGLVYTRLARVIARRAAHVILLPGTATHKLRRAFPAKLRREATSVRSMREAVRRAKSVTQQGTILLSPAAASFGLFVNEFDRGDQFVDAVQGGRA